MKKFTKAGAKFAAAAVVSVMALGYTTSVWAEESSGITNKETVFANIKGTQTDSLSDIRFKSTKDKTINETSALRIRNVDELNLVNEDEHGLYIGNHTYAFENAEGIGINVENSQSNFNIKCGLSVEANGIIIDPEENVQSQGIVREPEANVSMKAVGFYGKNGSSLIKAKYVSSEAWNRVAADSIGKLKEETRGMDLNNFAINIFAKENIEISSLIPTKNMLAGEKAAQGMVLNSSKASLQAEDINISATVGHDVRLTRAIPAISFGPVNGIHADLSELDMQAGGTIIIGAGIKGFTGNNELAAINASNSKLDIKAKKGIEIVAANMDAAGNIQNENVYAILAEKSAISLDGGDGGISITGDIKLADNSFMSLTSGKTMDSINGNIAVLKNSTLKLSGNYLIGERSSSRSAAAATMNGNLTVDNSTLVVDGIVGTSGITTLNNAKIYMYDANNAEDGFHALSIKNLDIAGSNELFLRADSSKGSDVNRGGLNSDVIGISDTKTGEGKFDVNVFDKGMKNGYGMGADGEKTLNNPITVLYSRDGNVDLGQLVNSVKVTNYDNGIWRYAYEMNAVSDGNKVVIKNVNVTAALSASGSQRSLHSANKAAGALAIGVLGNDNALHAHLREAQGAGEREEVWAQYLGGKLKSDGMQLKHNGVELGYDAYVGNNWTFGVSGMQTRGNTQLDSGSGKAKTNVGTVYGAWHGGSTYLNLEAKAGRVSSESKTFGGTVLQKINGEFSAPAYSVSAEYGSTHELPAAWYLEPAVRLSYVHLGAADYGVQVQDTLARVANDSLDSFILRGGAKLGRRLGAKGSFYVKAAAVYDFGGDLATTVSADGRTAHYEDSLGGWGVEYGAGLEYKLGKAANISLDVERRSGGELKRDWGVNIGVNYSF